MKRHPHQFRRNRRGSYLALTMIIALALTAIGASFISVTTTASKSTEADFTEQNLVYVAETGIDQAISTLNRYLAKSSTDGESWVTPQPNDALKEWTGATSTAFGSGGWTASGDDYRKDFGIFTLGNGRKARLRVVVRKVPTPYQMALTPSIVAEVTYDPDGKLGNLGSTTYSRQFAVLMRRSTRYQNSLVGTNGITFGDSFTVDSYDSRISATPSALNLHDKAVVATLSNKDGAISGTSPVIYGYLATGGDDPTDNIGNKAHIFGPQSLPPYSGKNGKGVDPNRLVRDFSGTFTPKTAPATGGLLDLGILLQTLPVVNGLVVLPAGSYRLTNPLNLPKTITQVSTITETTGLGTLLSPLQSVTKTVTNELTVSTISTLGDVTIVVAGAPGADPATVPPIALAGNAKLLIPFNSSLKVYTPGNVDIGGGGLINGVLDLVTTTTGAPSKFMVYGTNTGTTDGKRQTIGISGSGNFNGVIDAPNADITLRSSSTVDNTVLDTGDTSVSSSSGGGSTTVSVEAGAIDAMLTLGSGSKTFGFQGSIIGFNVTSIGKFAFHYDEALGSLMFPSYTMDTWVELRGSNKVDMSQYGF